MYKKILKGTSFFAAVVCGVFLFLLLPPFPKKFDSVAWRTCQHYSDRFAMHQDFLNNHKLVGMKRKELIELLGPPNSATETSLTWDMGGAGAQDDNYFDFKLKDGTVESYNIDSH